MPAYVIVETDIADPERYERYRPRRRARSQPAATASSSVRRARVLEGDWQPSRLVVLELEDLAAAKR